MFCNKQCSPNSVTFALVITCLYILVYRTSGEEWIDSHGYLTYQQAIVGTPKCVPCKAALTRITPGNETVVCYGTINTVDLQMVSPDGVCESDVNDTTPHIQRLTRFTFTNRAEITVLSLKKYVMGAWQDVGAIFYDLTSLTHLYLENNHITSLKSSGKTSDLVKLEVLSLAHNPIEHLSNDSFKWLQTSQLKFLNMQGCTAIKSITNTAFMTLMNKSLSLDLSQTALTSKLLRNIAKSFEDSTEDEGLQTLGLSQMGLYEFPFGALRYVSHSLRKLSIQGSRLSDWHPSEQRASLSMTNLEKLNLKDNEFTNYPGILFNDTPALKELILDGNPLKSLDCGSFENMPNLTSIYLRSIGESFEWTECSLPYVKTLDFSHSKLLLRNLSSLQNSPLQYLILTNSSVTDITELGLNTLSNLKHLDLGNNKLKGNFINYSFPQNLEYLSLKSCSLRLNLQADPFYSLAKLSELDMSFNFIGTLSQSLFSKTPKLERLYLQNSHITSMHPQLFKNTSLSFLNLQNNWLTEVTKEMVEDFNEHDGLEIDLSNNPYICECLHADFLNIFGPDNETQEEIKFKLLYSDQPSSYECTTRRNNQIPVQLFQRKTKHLQDQELMYCSPGQRLENDNDLYTSESSTNDASTATISSTTMSITSDSFIEEKDDNGMYIAYILCSLGVILVAIVLTLGCYWKWWNIRLFAYLVKKTIVLSILKDESDLKHKRKGSYQYDVFVSFSDHNRTWILEELIPNLEQQCNIKVCLHERDFQAGLPILENIITCMDRSRCILLVLSHAFLQSHWCQFELNLAQHRLLEMRRDQLLLVLLENIPRNKCSKMLRYLLLTKTYIQWPERPSNEEKKMFWKKMQKAIGPIEASPNISIA